MKDERREN